MLKIIRSAALTVSLLLAASVYAQPAPDYQGDPADGPGNAQPTADAVDPPSRVARLSVITGAVSFVPAGENDWVEAQINRPLITGDKLWTDRGARAELQVGAASIRVDQQSSFNFLNLDDQNAQVELTQGTLNLRVRRLYDNQSYEIDTPTLAFVINRVGEYRIDVAPDGNGTIVTAFHGGGDAYGEGGARFRVEEGQSVRFNDAQLRDYASNSIPAPDDFDRFAFDRDGRWDNSPSRQYVSEDVIGYDDLDNNGSWSNDEENGSVWYPSTVAADWTPYSYGHWGWVGAYGWTWIDSSPWGFAPFHYGRWAYVHNRWGWCPGPLHVRPYYAPALVAFIGGGGGLRVGFAAGGPVGWFPLGPRDVYVPGYRVSRDYFGRVNNYRGINSVEVNNSYGNYSRGNFDYNRVNYANRNIAGAVTAVPGNVFVGARQIRGSAIAVNRESFANARVSGFAPIAPTRASLAFTGGRAAVAPPQAVLNRNIIAATRPPAPTASFAQRQAVLQRDPGRALPVTQLRTTTPTVIGNGQVAQRAAISGRPNVNVVTTNGAPIRNAGPTASPRNTTSQTEPGRTLQTGPALRGTTPQTPQNAAQNAQQLRQNTTVESRTVGNQPGTRPAAVNEQRNSLPSSRYANPNATSNIAPQNNVNRNDNLRQTRDAAPQYRSTTVDHQPQVQQQQQIQQQRVEQPRVEQRVQPQVQQQRVIEQPRVEQRVQPQVQQQRVIEQPRVEQRVQPQVQQQQIRAQPQVEQRVQPQVQQQQIRAQPQVERAPPPAPRERAPRDDKKDDKGHR